MTDVDETSSGEADSARSEYETWHQGVANAKATSLRVRLASALGDKYGPPLDDDEGTWDDAVNDVILPLVENFYEPPHLALAERIADTAGGPLMVLPDDGSLTAEQERRVNALARARDLVEQRGSPKGPFTAASVQVDVMDMHTIADYILSGDDPWADVKPPRKRWWRR